MSGVTDGSSITLRELANMSSGNADYVGQQFITDFQADPNKIFTLDELNSYALGQPANFAPAPNAFTRHSPYEPPVSVDKVAFVVAEGNAERGAGG